MIEAVIIDDEKSCRESLKNLLARKCPDQVEVVGSATNVESACRVIAETRPGLVFLDIALPPTDGFQVLEQCSDLHFDTIVTTAYSEYALRAIKLSALDYLLKPIDAEELLAAIEKVRLKRTALQHAAKAYAPERIVVPVGRSSLLVSPGEIIRIEATLKKTRFFLKNKKVVVSTKGISDYDKSLPGHIFFRAHREHIINMNEVREYITEKNGGWVIMTDNKPVPIAARRKKEFVGSIG